MKRTIINCVAIALFVAISVGCANHRAVNPSFALTSDDAKAALKEMASQPRALERPVIVLGGIYDPGLMANHIANQIQRVVSDDAHVRHCSFFFDGSFDRCARKLVEHVDRDFPTDDPEQTVEVDVVAFSMGGLVARHAASDDWAHKSGRRLRIARLFTVGSPHLGAKLAWVPTFDRRIIDMRRGSEFLTRLNSESLEYKVVPYARLGDEVVGAGNAAPPGQTPWWVSRTLFFSHAAGTDARILADIVRRLRGEEPFSTCPPSPLPDHA